MEIVIILLLIASVIWVVMKIWNREKDFGEASLAWQIVLSDPHYNKRKPLEERKYAVEGKAQFALGQ